MRASATSRIASPSVLPSAQPKADANKADDASPFALLVGSVQTKPAAQQPTAQQKDTQGKDDRHSGDKQKDADPASQASAATTQTVAQDAVKPVKTGKSDDKNGKDKSSDDSQLSANLQQVDPQTLPAVQMSAQQLASLTAANAAAAAPHDNAGEDEPAVTAAGPAGVAASGQSKPQAGQAAQDSQLAAQDSQVADQAAASGPAAAKANGQAPDPTKTQIASQSAAQAGTPAQATDQNGAQQTQPDGVQPAKPWQAKAQNAGDTKTDASLASDAKASEAKVSEAQAADARQATGPAPQPVAANDMPAIKPDAMIGNTAPVIGGPAPQGAQNSAAPTVAQTVQVQTAPTPNMPALAVEIAAKSQSGAKQFDIRLDPPELGRVEVRLSIDATGKASAHLSADQPQTLDLLQKDAPSLTRALRDAGLDVSQNGLNFSLRQQSGDTGAGNNQGRGGNGRSFTLSATASIDATQARAAYSAPADGRLDIRV